MNWRRFCISLFYANPNKCFEMLSKAQSPHVTILTTQLSWDEDIGFLNQINRHTYHLQIQFKSNEIKNHPKSKRYQFVQHRQMAIPVNKAVTNQWLILRQWRQHKLTNPVLIVVSWKHSFLSLQRYPFIMIEIKWYQVSIQIYFRYTCNINVFMTKYHITWTPSVLAHNQQAHWCTSQVMMILTNCSLYWNDVSEWNE